MKKLYLIGDSIRMNYDKYVIQALEGEADVYAPAENARFAAFTYNRLPSWEGVLKIGKELDVVHWNVGLHDVIHLQGDDQMTPPDIYKYYLDRICDKLEFLYPNAEKIFATTTPVQEHLYNSWFARYNADIERINEAALEVINKRGYRVNDLYSAVLSQPADTIYKDATHYNFTGSCFLASRVLDAVCPLLGVNAHPENMQSEEEMRKSEILR